MIILLGSKNPSKKIALEKALLDLHITDYEIISFDAPSLVSSKPIGKDIITGADNRNNYLKEVAIKEQINYDYLCSIEGGFTKDENGLPFVVTYCITEDSNGKKSTGKSLGLRLTQNMFECIKNGQSLNKLIEEINNEEDNKQKAGITGFLSRGLLNREDVDSEAVLSSFIPLLFMEERQALDGKASKMLVLKQK